VDFIQGNEFEVKTFSDAKEEFEISREIIKQGVKALIVTKGENGASIYFKQNERIDRLYIPAENVSTVNKVGCGDIFGSVFFYTYLKTKNLAESLVAANNVAGKSASTNNLNELSI
jgi:sugar/nucleoside kinase (ribokinase family)